MHTISFIENKYKYVMMIIITYDHFQAIFIGSIFLPHATYLHAKTYARSILAMSAVFHTLHLWHIFFNHICLCRPLLNNRAGASWKNFIRAIFIRRSITYFCWFDALRTNILEFEMWILLFAIKIKTSSKFSFPNHAPNAMTGLWLCWLI